MQMVKRYAFQSIIVSEAGLPTVSRVNAQRVPSSKQASRHGSAFSSVNLTD